MANKFYAIHKIENGITYYWNFLDHCWDIGGLDSFNLINVDDEFDQAEFEEYAKGGEVKKFKLVEEK